MSAIHDARTEFGHNGLSGLEAMAAGCPLLTDLSLQLTASGIHFVGTHFTGLKKCEVLNKREEGAATPAGFPSIEELQILYPAITWAYP